MSIYKVGSDELSFDLVDKRTGLEFEWIAYSYSYLADEWYGSGKAIGLGKDGRLYWVDLGHCSCYGPMEGEGKDGWELLPYLEFFGRPETIFDDDELDDLKSKVLELLLKKTK